MERNAAQKFAAAIKTVRHVRAGVEGCLNPHTTTVSSQVVQTDEDCVEEDLDEDMQQ